MGVNTARRVLGGLWLLAAVMGPSAAEAEEFNGKTAAYIDWAVKNCEVKSTDQEHKLVEQVNANDKSHDAFQRQYMAQFQAKELVEAGVDTKSRQAKCDSLKEWFGPAGTHLAGLMTWEKAPAGSPGSSSTAAGGGKKGRRHSQ